MMNSTKAALAASALAVLTLAPTDADALSVTDLGGGIYQIDFAPITFVATAASDEVVGFVVQDFFLSDASTMNSGVASSGAFTTTIDGVETTDNGSGGFLRGPFRFTTSVVDRNDLLVTTGVTLPPAVAVGQTVTFSAENLQFEYNRPLPGFTTGPLDAIMIDVSALALSDAVEIEAVPLPAGLPLMLLGLGGLGVIARRRAG